MWQAHGMKIYFMFRTFNLNKISQALNCEDTVGLPKKTQLVYQAVKTYL